MTPQRPQPPDGYFMAVFTRTRQLRKEHPNWSIELCHYEASRKLLPQMSLPDVDYINIELDRMPTSQEQDDYINHRATHGDNIAGGEK